MMLYMHYVIVQLKINNDLRNDVRVYKYSHRENELVFQMFMYVKCQCSTTVMVQLEMKMASR